MSDHQPEGPQALSLYNALLRQQADEVRIWGQPVTVYDPKVRDKLGYENLDNPTPNDYNVTVVKARLNFNPGRSVFYKFNYFPTEQEELVTCFFHPSAHFQEGCFIRTKVMGNASPYGDQIFKIVKIFDEGIFQTLKRTYFVKPMNDSSLWQMLVPGELKAEL